MLSYERCPDEDGDLDGMGVCNSCVNKIVFRDAVDGRRQYDVGTHVALCVGLDYKQVDIPVKGGVGDGLHLIDIRIVVDGVAGMHATSIIRENTCT